MKKLGKKTLAIAMSSVMATGLLAGCGGSATKSDQTGNSGGTEVSTNNDTYEIVMELITYGKTPADVEKVEAAINEITVPKINATVKFLPVTIADHATKVGLLAAGGEKVDIIISGITTSAATLHSNGVLADLTELLPQYAPDLMEKEGELLDVGKFDGGQYAIPANIYPGESLNLLYNKEMAEEYGITIPEKLENYEEWDAFFAECKKKLPEDVYPFTLGDGKGTSTVNFDSNFDTFGDTTYIASGALENAETGTEIVNWYTTDNYKKLIEKRHEWYEAGYVVPDSMTSGFTTHDTVSAGQCFAFQNPFQSNVNEVTLSKITGVDLGYIKLTDPLISGGSAILNSWGIPVTSEKPEKALELLNLIFSDVELANLMNYGIEGVHYQKVSDHIIDYPEGSNPAEIGWGGFLNWFGDTSECYQFSPMTEDFYTTIDQYGLKGARVSNALGYTFDTSAFKTELAGITSIIDTEKPSLECGLVDVDEALSTFISDLEANGINEIIAENQKQFTEWLNNK